MPKAPSTIDALPDAPLSVAAVSVRLGISPSTLRTWERRYGLGLGDRRAGAHRRYLPDDVARLARMVDLIRAGVPTADAAALILSRTCQMEQPPAVEAPSAHTEIVAAAQMGEPEHLVRMLESAITADGLVRTWTGLIEPALETIRASDEGEDPGHAPSALLTLAVLRVLTLASDLRPTPKGGQAGALVLADEEHSLAAHVMGVALQWHGVETAIMSTGCHGGTSGSDRVTAHVARRPAAVGVIAGRGATCEGLIRTMTEDLGMDVVVVGANSPEVLDPRVVRVRSLAAAVEEASALAASATVTA